MILLNKLINVPYNHRIFNLSGDTSRQVYLKDFESFEALKLAYENMEISKINDFDVKNITRKIVVLATPLDGTTTVIDPSEEEICETGFTKQFFLNRIPSGSHAAIYGDEILAYINEIEPQEQRTQAERELERLALFFGGILSRSVVILVQDSLPETIINLLSQMVSFYIHDNIIGSSTKYSYTLAIQLTNE